MPPISPMSLWAAAPRQILSKVSIHNNHIYHHHQQQQLHNRLRNILPLPTRPIRFHHQFRNFSATAPKINKHDVTAKKPSEPIPVPNTIPQLPLWQRLGPLTAAASAYGRSQHRRPYTTQFLSCLVIYFLSDLSAQSINGDEYDPVRTLRNLIIGGTVAIPSYRWYIFLSNHFNFASHGLSLATKILVSQVAYTPIFNTYFFGAQALLSGASPSEIMDRITYAVPTSVFNSCKVWPLFTAFSFTFIPMEHRSVFAGVINIGWQTYLACLNRMAELEATTEAEVLQPLQLTQRMAMANQE